MFGKILKKAAGASTNTIKSGYSAIRDSYPVKRVLGENAYSGFNVVRTDEDGIPTSLNNTGRGILAATIGAAAVYNAINERYTNDMGT